MASVRRRRVKKYINQVAFSSAEEFIQKYQGKDEQAIMVTLDWLTSFMVAQGSKLIPFL